jgi:hypothetical protein
VKNWEAIAKAHGLDVSARELERIAPQLAALEESFRPLINGLAPETEPALSFHAEESE